MPSVKAKKVVVTLRWRGVPRSPACPQIVWEGKEQEDSESEMQFTTQAFLIKKKKYLMLNHTPNVNSNVVNTHHIINTLWLKGIGLSLLPHQCGDVRHTYQALSFCLGAEDTYSGPHTYTGISLTKVSPPHPLCIAGNTPQGLIDSKQTLTELQPQHPNFFIQQILFLNIIKI